MPPGPCVGIVANPASGRDIRRLVAGASVVGNADKAGMVFRALTGLRAAGVHRALMMPAADGLGSALDRLVRGHGAAALPDLELVAQPITGTAEDTTRAVEAMCDAGAGAIVVFGGDGTHRVVAKACGDVPLCALSTGTNNAFPELREATVAGLAAGLAVTGRGGPNALRQEAGLAVDAGGRADLAVVDVTLTAEPFVGARAVWRPGTLREVVVTMADPAAVGLSALAGALAPFERGSGRGLHVRLAPSAPEARLVLDVPLVPGLVVPVPVAGFSPMRLGDAVTLAGEGSLALDGEREIELRGGAAACVRLVPGPARIDVDAVMRHHAASRATWVQPVAG